MASGKKKGKSKGVTLALTTFLQGNDSSAPAHMPTQSSSSWAAEMDNVDNGDGEEVRMTFDRSKLPTAPKAARAPDFDLNRISDDKPFTAFVGNLPYDVSEEKIAEFFENRNLKVEGVRLPNENGRQRGFGYVEFVGKEDLVQALGMNEEMFNGRKLRVDLAETSGGDRERGGDSGRSDRNDWRGGGGDPDRTEGDWRRRDPPAFSGNDRGGGGGFSDRGGDRFGDRDRYEDRGGSRGFTDRGGDRDRRGFGDRDRDRDGGGFGDRGGGFGDRSGGFGDRSGGFGDRGGGRYGDRDSDRYGGRDSDRFGGGRSDFGGGRSDDCQDWRDGRSGGGGFSDDRRYNRYDDRRGGGDRYGGRNYDDRGFGGRRDNYRRDDEGGRSGGYREERSGSRDGSREGPKERPRLQLQPRSKPVEPGPSEQSRQSSIFGSAKPVDTAAKEREIEEKMKKLDTSAHFTSEEASQSREGGRTRRDSDGGRGRRDSDGGRGRRDSDGGRGGGRERQSSNSGSATSRRDSETSHNSDESHRDDRGYQRDERKMVPAPPPKENAWSKPKSDVVGRPSEPARQLSSDSDYNRRENRRSSGDSGRRPSDEGRRSGYGRGSNQENRRDRPDQKRRDKQLPRSVDDMPKLDQGPAKNWADVNKFAVIGSDED